MSHKNNSDYYYYLLLVILLLELQKLTINYAANDEKNLTITNL